MLGNILNRHFNLLAFDRRVVSEQHQAFWNVSVFEAFAEMVSNLSRDVEKKDGNTARLQDVERRAAAELLSGVGIHCELVVAVA